MRISLRTWSLLLLITLILVSSTPGFSQRRSSSATRSSSTRTSKPTRTTSPREVSVRGYYRRDGTYVAPHKRTAADGNFYNNWSTYGNVNPYTGKPGTKRQPPAGYGEDVWVDGYYRSDGTYVRGHYRSAPDGDPSNNYSYESGTSTYTSSSYEEADRRLRQNAAAQLRELGYDVNWQNHSYYQLADMELRIRQAQRLRALGITSDWRQHTVYEMSDWEIRIRQAKRLADLGLSVNWRDHTYYEMSDWELRISAAKELERLGATVDWRQFTYFQLWEIRRSIQKRP